MAKKNPWVVVDMRKSEAEAALKTLDRVPRKSAEIKAAQKALLDSICDVEDFGGAR